MQRIAQLKMNTRTGKWEALFEGKVLAASNAKAYVIDSIRSGRCIKANNLKIADIAESAEHFSLAQNGEAIDPEETERFSINERFHFLEDFVTMVADRTAPSLVVTGEGGLGKTFTVNKALKAAGLQNANDLVGVHTEDTLSAAQSRKLYAVVKGYSTAKGLYRLLYENRNRIIQFDDCDNILKDTVALNLLKGALDSYDRRIISWNAESFGDDDLPKSFEFKGGIVFISNLPMHKIDQAVRSRSICVDLSMNARQKIERMHVIIKSEEFLPDYEFAAKDAALHFIDSMKDEAHEISFRTLISVTKVASRGENWQRAAEYLLTSTN